MPASNKEFDPLDKHNFRWIVFTLCLVIIPHLVHLPIWLTIFVCCVVLFKLCTNKNTGVFFSLILTIIALIAVVAEYGKLFGLSAGVNLLIIMLSLKLLETKTYRDGIVVISMTYFLVITNFFYTQSIPTAIYMFFIVVFTTAGLVSLNQKSIKLSILGRFKISGGLVLQALPIMLILFFLFPRLPNPLWGIPADAYTGKTGLSDKMSPGKISNLAMSNEVAFRVKFHTETPHPRDLYWRSIVLYNFDGVTWTEGIHQYKYFPPPFKPLDAPVSYTVTAEPHNLKWLFALDLPAPDTKVNKAFPVNYEYLIKSKIPLNKLKQYSVVSHLNYAFRKVDPSQSLIAKALNLPAESNPKTIALAQQLISSGLSQDEIIQKVLMNYNKENFVYTLKPPQYGKNSIDEFLFEFRKGFCEHYASSFAFLMRALGIPSRIVLGYQGGEINPIDDYMIVRQADAHAWVEVWQEHKGWLRIDPTAMVSPSRIENGLDAALNQDESPMFLLKRNSAVFLQASRLWDMVNYRWSQWVLDYDSKKQKEFMSYFGFEDIRAHQLILILTISLFVIALVISFYSFRNRVKRKFDKVHKLYLKFCSKLSKLGLSRLPYEGPLDYCKRLQTANIPLKEEINQITQMYIELRYSKRFTRTRFNEFKKRIRVLNVR